MQSIEPQAWKYSEAAPYTNAVPLLQRHCLHDGSKQCCLFSPQAFAGDGAAARASAQVAAANAGEVSRLAATGGGKCSSSATPAAAYAATASAFVAAAAGNAVASACAGPSAVQSPWKSRSTRGSLFWSPLNEPISSEGSNNEYMTSQTQKTELPQAVS